MNNNGSIKESNCAISKEDAIIRLRKRFIEEIYKNNKETIELHKFLWDEADAAFPGGPGRGWSLAAINIDLSTMRLYAYVACYPDAFGQAPESRISITAEELRDIAIRFDLSEELKCMEDKRDWESLKDETLTEALHFAEKKRNRKQKEEAEQIRIKYGIFIPKEFDKQPKMAFDTVSILLMQRNGSSRVVLSKTEGKYYLNGTAYAMWSTVEHNSNGRELSDREAVWAEELITRTCKSNDSKEWNSLWGFDKMKVLIVKNGKVVVDVSGAVQLKYYNLMHSLEELACYGSINEAEKKIYRKKDSNSKYQNLKQSWRSFLRKLFRLESDKS